MGLQNTVELPQGFTADYWRITEEKRNYAAGYIDVGICCYLDKAARDLERAPVRDLWIRISAEALGGTIVDTTLAQLYDAVKVEVAAAEASIRAGTMRRGDEQAFLLFGAVDVLDTEEVRPEPETIPKDELPEELRG